MSHVDEGRIHAYLDRQLEFADRAARAELEAHIAQCPSCASLLAEARTVHARAEVVLESSGPTDVAAPPFERVEMRAHDGGARSARVRTLRITRSFAWAASIVLAVAVGWYARVSVGDGTAFDTGPQAETLTSSRIADSASRVENVRLNVAESETQPLTPATVEASLGGVDDLDARGRLAQAGAAGAPQPTAAPRTAGANEAEVRGELDRLQRRVLAEQIAVTELRQSEVARERDRLADEFAALPERMRGYADSLAMIDAVRVESVSKAENRPAETIADWRAVDRGAAEQLIGASIVSVEGLPISAIYIPATAATMVVRVTQLLPSGDSLEILQQRIEPSVGLAADAQPQPQEVQDERRDAAARPSVTTMIRPVGELIVTGRAAIDPDSLRTLLGRLRVTPESN